MKPSVRWLTRYDRSGASSRYRVFQYVEHETLGGFRHRVIPMNEWNASPLARFGGIVRRFGEVGRAHRADVVVVQKEPIMPPALSPALARIERWSAPVIWDVDDAVWMGRRGALDAARWMARRSDVVVAGNELIAQWMTDQGARDTVVIPTTFTPSAMIDTPRERSSRNPTDRAISVVWVGSHATTPLLNEFIPTIARWIEAQPSIHVELVGAGPSALSALPRVTITEWSPSAEHEALNSADFGLALQPPGGYNDFKCGFKIVQYLAHGVIPIATDGVVHRQIVGDVGVFIDRQDPTLEVASERISTPPTAADRDAASERWRAHFSTKVGARRWAEVLETRL